MAGSCARTTRTASVAPTSTNIETTTSARILLPIIPPSKRHRIVGPLKTAVRILRGGPACPVVNAPRSRGSQTPLYWPSHLPLGSRRVSEASVHRSAIRLFAILFFLSGVAGLVYEVTWTRLLRLPMGNTVHSMTTVLAAFMGGLALGAWIAGRWIERGGSPLGTYAKLEAAIGVFCFVLPWLVQAETP